MTKDELEKLETGKKTLDEFLERNGELQIHIPKLQEIRDFISWTIDAEAHKPDEADEIESPILRDAIAAQAQFLEDNVPTLPKFDAHIYQGGTAANTTISSTMYAYVTRVGDIPTDDARNYATEYSAKYHQLLGSYGRVDEIRSLLSRIPHSLALKRLDPAIEGFSAWKSNARQRTSAANAIRNLLHGLKGDMKNLAFGETKRKEGWQNISAKLARGGVESTEYSELLRQEKVYNELIKRLSPVVKDMEGGSVTDLSVIWTQTLDLIHVILNYILV